MKYFEHLNASSYEEASESIKKANGKAQACAGGSDLLGVLKDRIQPEYPETVVNLKQIPDFDKLEIRDHSLLVIGAGRTLSKLASDAAVKDLAPALAEAAYSVASPLIRNIGTLGGNVCQDVRCWYYRYPDSVGDRLDCKRKGGSTCYAINGENRYHSVFGGMEIGASPCTANCPAGTDIPGYMAKLRAGDWDGAAQILMNHNPMPMMTSRICPHLCQDDCNQCTYGDSVNIHGVERSLGDYILKHADSFFAPQTSSGKAVAVIGAGPGGLTAAYYLRRAGLSVTVYDRMEKAGGVLQYGIPHYRLPKTIVDAYVSALTAMGVQFKLGVEVGKDITVEEIRKSADRVYFGTGAWKQPVLGLEGENLTEFGLDFLVEVNTYLKKAIGEDVLVCGGGNVAMDVALTAKRLGAKSVKLVCLEQEKEMPASAEEVARAKEEGVELLNGWGLSRVMTRADGKVTGLEAMRCTSVYDENNRFSPVYDRNELKQIQSDSIILATGQRVDLSFLGSFADQLKTSRGLIEADAETGETKEPGMYAGGDAVTGPNIAIRAIHAGRIAASSIIRELGGCSTACSISHSSAPDFLHFDPAGIEAAAAHKLPECALTSRSLTAEDASSFDLETTLSEAARCMNCGCYAVSPSDLTPVLLMSDAEILTTERTLTAEELFTKELTVQQVLHKGELVKEIHVHKLPGISHYDKKRVRNAIDFAIVSLASNFVVENGTIRSARLVYGGVAPVPYRMSEVEQFLIGKEISEETAKAAAELAVKHASPMGKNEYKLAFMKDLMENAIMRLQ